MPPDAARTLLAWAEGVLAASGVPTPALDARLLLQHAAQVSREDLILEPDRPLEADAAEMFRILIDRRVRREPVSRILGTREFYGRPFTVTPAVLDPRPDTETLIDAALRILPRDARILDLGTGSGAILLTLLAERGDATGVGVDVSPDALAVARRNAVACGVAGRAELVEGSWFGPVTGTFDLIVSNPPYITRADIAALDPDVRCFDPTLALDGGSDGLEAYRAIAAGAGRVLSAIGHILVEIGAGQETDVNVIFANAGFASAGMHCDLGGHVRCLGFNHFILKKPVGNPQPSG